MKIICKEMFAVLGVVVGLTISFLGGLFSMLLIDTNIIYARIIFVGSLTCSGVLTAHALILYGRLKVMDYIKRGKR